MDAFVLIVDGLSRIRKVTIVYCSVTHGEIISASHALRKGPCPAIRMTSIHPISNNQTYSVGSFELLVLQYSYRYTTLCPVAAYHSRPSIGPTRMAIAGVTLNHLLLENEMVAVTTHHGSSARLRP